MTVETQSSTHADVIAERLRADIIEGVMSAGAKLGLKDLCLRYEVGMSPLREALNRLVGEGYVDFASQRGFAVPMLDRRDLQDLIDLRVAVETTALRHAQGRGGDRWEAGIISAFHMLERNVHRMFLAEAAEAHIYNAVHLEFHQALFGGCISARMANLHLNLFNQAYRYRKSLRHVAPSPDAVLDEHRRLMEAVLSRDFERGSAAIAQHLTLTMAVFDADRDVSAA
jgi:DNA-binding GntR family transcriptional regulator